MVAERLPAADFRSELSELRDAAETFMVEASTGSVVKPCTHYCLVAALARADVALATRGIVTGLGEKHV